MRNTIWKGCWRAQLSMMMECFSPILLNATSLNVEGYYNKAVNYTLMATFVSSVVVAVFF
jgi:hypothetical protein